MSPYTIGLERLLLPLGDRLLHTEFMATLRAARAMAQLPSDRLRAIQRDRLVGLLRHASTAVPHYRELGVEPDDDPFIWLSRFPILTKEVLRDRTDALVSATPTSSWRRTAVARRGCRAPST